MEKRMDRYVLLRQASGASLLCLLAACGSGSSTAPATPEPLPPKVESRIGFNLVAGGSWSDKGAVDGPLAVAKFNWPANLAVDGAGNIFIADTGNNTIRKLSPSGQVSTVADINSIVGSTPAPGYTNIEGMAVDAAGNIYVTSEGGLRKIDVNGKVVLLARGGKAETPVDGPLASARFFSMDSLTVDRDGNIYLPDQSQIRKIRPSGMVTTLAGRVNGFGTRDGVGSAAEFFSPGYLTVDANGNVYVVDGFAVRKITPAGVVTTLAGRPNQRGFADGPGEQARFRLPTAIAVDGAGVVYVADDDGGVVRRISPSGVVRTIAGALDAYGSTNGLASTARFGSARGLLVAADGKLIVADTSFHALRKIDAEGRVSTFAGGKIAEPPGTDGIGAAARFNNISGVTADKAGNYYVADSSNCLIRKITPAGATSVLAGAVGECSVLDGVGAAARFENIGDLTIDGGGNLFVNDGKTVRKISPVGVVSTVAGKPGPDVDKLNGIGSGALFSGLKGVSADAAGNLTVSDGWTNCRDGEALINGIPQTSLRTVSVAGVVTTVPGLSNSLAKAVDGPLGVASFACPGSLTQDVAGILYFVDSSIQLRKRSLDGTVSTIPTGDKFVTLEANSAARIDVDERGNLLMVNGDDNVFMIAPQGTVSRVVGATASPGDLLPLPVGVPPGPFRAVHALGNKQFLLATPQQVYKVVLP
ncbi:hypothetical protein ACFOLJ_24315 [Rugamonas sp. CCM 8940]